tara:strand:- start:13501 stop:14205 length:705 start_codon:yes stop_codon:yes gene_type:complete
MIDAVRNTVLAILNKNNYGYLSPSDFNLYAQQAQLEIFEDYFYQYNTQINLENARRSGTDYANLSKGILEVIDLFSKTGSLTQTASAVNTYTMPSDYYIMNRVMYNGLEVERVNQGKITMLLNSMITAPSKDFPAYTTEASIMTVYPTTITGASDISAQYVRYPVAPKWTYRAVLEAQGPVFNQSAVDYQDFELPLDNLNDLVIKICQYAGVEIREAMVVQYAQAEEQQNNTQQ